MPGRVVVVERGRGRGGAGLLYLPTVLRSLRLTLRHLVRSLRGLARGRTGLLVAFPEQRRRHPSAFRGMPVLVARADGSPRCVACGLCEVACPTRCIHLEAGELDAVSLQPHPERFDLDVSRCLFCGLCEEACPEEAIVMSPLVELAGFGRGDLVYTRDDLLVPEASLDARLGFLRAAYDRPREADASDAPARA